MDSAVTIEIPEALKEIQTPAVVETLPLLCDGLASMLGSDGTITIQNGHENATKELLITAGPLADHYETNQTVFEPAGSASNVKLYVAKLLIEKIGEVAVVEQSDDRFQLALRLKRSAAAMDEG